MKEFQPYIAEFIAAFGLVFIGAGAVVMNTLYPSALGLLGVAFAHGLVLMCMIYSLGHISGAHANPAVTAAVWVARKIESKKAMGYIVSQLLGASVAGFLLLMLFPGAPAHLGTPDLGAGVGPIRGIAIEAVLTFFLAFTIFNVAVDKRAPAGIYGFAIGMVLVFDILFGGILTGAAMNPARAFGPAIASGYWAAQPVYWVGPLLGAIVAALVWKYGLSDEGGRR